MSKMARGFMKKVWMITGASRGLGAKIAEAVLSNGDTLIATARSRGSLDAIEGTADCLRLALDVTNETQAKSVVADAIARFGRIDVLVNNAGYGLTGAIEETSSEEVEAVYRTNVFGLLNVTRAVLPVMRKQQSGHIMNVSSMGGYQANPTLGIYASTKFAIEGISEALYGEMKPLGIHVTAIGPGFLRTDFLDPSSLQHAKLKIEDYAAAVEKTRSFSEVNNGLQPGDPGKLAKALLHLVSVPEPPLRIPFGSDALARLLTKNSFVAEQTERWRSLSESTDFS
jgi:NAD(P)-dependent dehydrogenase (short-subunit alcohol dehydrogenase family)